MDVPGLASTEALRSKRWSNRVASSGVLVLGARRRRSAGIAGMGASRHAAYSPSAGVAPPGVRQCAVRSTRDPRSRLCEALAAPHTCPARRSQQVSRHTQSTHLSSRPRRVVEATGSDRAGSGRPLALTREVCANPKKLPICRYFSWARLGSNQRLLACEAIGLLRWKAAICRKFGDHPGEPMGRCSTWFAGVYRGSGPQN